MTLFRYPNTSSFLCPHREVNRLSAVEAVTEAPVVGLGEGDHELARVLLQSAHRHLLRHIMSCRITPHLGEEFVKFVAGIRHDQHVVSSQQFVGFNRSHTRATRANNNSTNNGPNTKQKGSNTRTRLHTFRHEISSLPKLLKPHSLCLSLSYPHIPPIFLFLSISAH